jgi:isocitrate dehydrogenase
MEATLKILRSSEANLKIEVIEIGQNIYEKGFSSGITPSAWETLNNSKVLLKAPITTPQGKGYKSLNVTIRKNLGLYANIRPIISLHPFINNKHPTMDVVIIRENEEDLYSGIEHRQTENFYQCLKIISEEGCRKIIQTAFDYAITNNRKKVTCFSKDNIMKMTDGLFHKIFDDIAAQYPNIDNDHYIIDIGSARLAAKPENFDVIVTMNLYGDIISDIAAEISGSVGLAGSSNIGEQYAMFEAIHGSAPDIAGKKIANPSGLIQASAMMLLHLGQIDAATSIHNALLKTIEDGIHTVDIYNQKTSIQKTNTDEFAEAVINNLGKKPRKLPIANFSKNNNNINRPVVKITNKKLIGLDLFIDWQKDFDSLLHKIKAIESKKLEIKTISSRGLLLWPLIDKNITPKYNSEQTIIRMTGKGIISQPSNNIVDKKSSISHQDIIDILQIFAQYDIDFIKYEGLYSFDGIAGYTSNQGE